MLAPPRGACAPVALLLVAAGAAGPGYDCSDQTHLQAWPQAQKDVCCIIKGVGCESVTGGPTTTSQATSVTMYDCAIDRDSWDVDQQNWCCEHWSLGCSGSPLGNASQGGGDEAGSVRHVVFDCSKDVEQWSTKWNRTKQDWCCGHWNLGCGPGGDPSQDGKNQFECEQGIMNWHKGWSNSKKAYCCQHASEEIKAQLRDGDGCTTPTPQSPALGAAQDSPRCQAIVSETPDMTGWTATFAPGWYDNDAYVSAGAVGSAGAVTVDSGEKGCTAFVYGGGDFTGNFSTLAPGKYQQEDLAKMGVVVMSIKVIEANVTVSTTTASVTSTTSATTGSNSATSSTTSTTSTTTTTTTTTGPKVEANATEANASGPGGAAQAAVFDCLEGYDDWERVWNSTKKDWCCAKHGNCNSTAKVIKVDCWVNLSNWEEAWSSEKKQFCCGAHFKCPSTVEGLSATGEKPFPWDPELGGYICESLSNVSGTPTAGKQKAMQWCCKHQKTGCTADAATEAQQFDCHEGLERAKDGWSDEKKEWCCEREQLGCVQTFDCKAGGATWRIGWSQDKKDFCCEEQMWQGPGCPFNCQVGKSTWRTSWTGAKKEWCCEHGGDDSVCPATATTTVTETTKAPECVSTPEWTNGYGDCQTDDKNQAECTPTGYTCEGYEIRGFCADGQVLQNFTAGNAFHHPELNCCQCGGGFRAKEYTPAEANCNVSWPGRVGAADCGKCTHVVSAENHSTCGDYCRDIGLECFYAAEDYHTLPGSTSADCPVKANASCSDNLLAMDVKSSSMICGCRSAPGTEALVFDCAGDDADSWNELKRAWCCANQQLGCTTSTLTTSAPPETTATSASETSASKTATLTATSPSETSTTTAPTSTATLTSATSTKPAYDCTVGPLNPLANWSMVHQSWCCEHEDTGCPPTTTSTKAPFDCRAGLWNWREGWSDKKKGWCCSNEKLGCQKSTQTSTTTLSAEEALQFDCWKDLDQWRDKWPADKKEYCCKHAHECPSEDEFDCWANISTWEDSWSDEKTRHCCGHHYRCPNSTGNTTGSASPWHLRSAFPWDAKDGRYTCEGLNNVTGSVSPGKKKAMQWCCENEKIGCPPDVAEYSSKQSHGATMKASSTTATTTAADASAGSDGNSSDGGESTTEPFDCKEGRSDSMTGWTVAKYEWCCHNQSVGCLDEADLVASVALVESTRRLGVVRPWNVALVLGIGLAAAAALSFSRRSRRYWAVDPMMTVHLGSVDGESTELSGCEGLTVVSPE